MTLDVLDNLNTASLTRRDVIAQRDGANGETAAVKRVKADEL